MLTVDRWTWDNQLPHFRKIHVYKDYYLVSIVSKSGISGKTNWNFKNAFLYLFSFIFILVKVVD